jgi:NhaA family Na+:H+ antiporter
MNESVRIGPGPSAPPEASESLLRLARLVSRPLERFLRIEAASGVLLLLSSAIALLWANSRWSATYHDVWHTPLGIRFGRFAFERTLEWFVNDALMVIFFFVVGLEIRRELHHGELSEGRRAALPAAAALGGMLAPAGLYLLLAGEPATRSGWGVPMATDIAFALGILTLLGRRVPPALRVLLLALAVIDDLGAIVVIALFYSSGVAVSGLWVAALGFLGILILQRLGVRAKIAYVLLGTVAWAGIASSGIHPTIAGVLVGLMTPVRAWLGPEGFLVGVREELERFARMPEQEFSAHELTGSLRRVDFARREALSPAESLIAKLHPGVAFGVMPIFALANAGVSVAAMEFDRDSWRSAFGVGLGLLLGKPIGIGFAMVCVMRSRLATLPRGLSLRHLVVLSVVSGVGFTMALFIAQLAFVEPRLLAAAKLGVLAASAVAAVLAIVLGRSLLPTTVATGAALTADEAESSTES